MIPSDGVINNTLARHPSSPFDRPKADMSNDDISVVQQLGVGNPHHVHWQINPSSHGGPSCGQGKARVILALFVRRTTDFASECGVYRP